MFGTPCYGNPSAPQWDTYGATYDDWQGIFAIYGTPNWSPWYDDQNDPNGGTWGSGYTNIDGSQHPYTVGTRSTSSGQGYAGSHYFYQLTSSATTVTLQTLVRPTSMWKYSLCLCAIYTNPDDTTKRGYDFEVSHDGFYLTDAQSGGLSYNYFTQGVPWNTIPTNTYAFGEAAFNDGNSGTQADGCKMTSETIGEVGRRKGNRQVWVAAALFALAPALAGCLQNPAPVGPQSNVIIMDNMANGTLLQVRIDGRVENFSLPPAYPANHGQPFVQYGRQFRPTGNSFLVIAQELPSGPQNQSSFPTTDPVYIVIGVNNYAIQLSAYQTLPGGLLE
jgi:hypothetical protein